MNIKEILQSLPLAANNERSNFLQVLTKFAKEENVVTRSVYKNILKGRIDREEVL